MPWYRINGMTVHMRGTKLPPACVAQIGISSLHAEATLCMSMSAYLCDGPIASGRTCDKPLCAVHATEIGKDKHLCTDCRLKAAPRGQGSLFTSLVEQNA